MGDLVYWPSELLIAPSGDDAELMAEPAEQLASSKTSLTAAQALNPQAFSKSIHSLYLDVTDFIGFHLSGPLIPANPYYEESTFSYSYNGEDYFI